MKIWIDAQLPPTLATWLNSAFAVEAYALKDIGLRDARDIEIFEAARVADAVMMKKDSDFSDFVCRLGTPPRIIWLPCCSVTSYRIISAKIASSSDR